MVSLMSFLRRAIALFLPAATVAVLAAGLVYVVVQQAQRGAANDPQVQLAEDAAARLDDGAAPDSVVGTVAVDVARSLAPFLVVYDSSGHVLAAGGSLDGHDPVPPIGVLQNATATGRDIVTWQPEPGVRIATVVIPWHGGTVLAGRNLRLVEQREDTTLLLSGAGLVVLLCAAGVMALLGAAIWPPGSPSSRSSVAPASTLHEAPAEAPQATTDGVTV
jgi:hypothetical protein